MVNKKQKVGALNNKFNSTNVVINNSNLQSANYKSSSKTKVQQSRQNKNTPSSILIKVVAVVIMFAIIVYAVYYFFNYGGFPSSNSNNSVTSILATHKPAKIINLANVIINYTNNTKQLNVSYNGSITLISTSTLTGSMSINIPMKIEYEKYYNLSRTMLNLNNVPLLENLSFVEISNKSEQYSCANSSSSFALTGSNGFKCQNITSNKTLSELPININLKEVNFDIIESFNKTSYKGQPCYVINGNGIINIPANLTSKYTLAKNSTLQRLNYSINGCMSTQFGLPLNLSMALSTNTMKILITLAETNFNANTNPTIAKLPGPIENVSSMVNAIQTSSTPITAPASTSPQNIFMLYTSVAPFQQMINITESDFSGLQYNSNFADFEYTYANGTVIPAWIERNDSGKLITWVKLKNGISTNSTTVIYLKIEPGVNLLSNSGTYGIGEAPELSRIYGEYDDGASVFNYYTNFAG
ncbi:MAG: hypothetical protein ACP5RQ_02595, partial [Candidatus Micrarchaeia archaeon]